MDRDLLGEVNALCCSARFLRLRAVGQEANRDPALQEILDGWERGDWEQRFYCVQSCAGSGDAARLLRMIDDPSRVVAGLALRLLATHGSDDVLVDVLAKLTHSRRRRLIVRLGTNRRFPAVDAFLAKGFAESFPRIAELLPFGSPQAVARHLSQADEGAGVRFWERLARRHPRIAAATILDKLAATEQPDGLLLQYARSVLYFTGRTQPDLTVQLVRALAQFVPLASLRVTEALYRRPHELAEIVLETEESAPFSLAPVAHRLDQELRLKIRTERPYALPFDVQWFRRIPSPERSEIYQEANRAWRDGDGLLSCDVLMLLPSSERVAEAERIATLPILSTRPQTQAIYAAYLPWAALRATADRFLIHPEGEFRAWGWSAILVGLRFHRDEAARVLTMIRQRKFEQDPVRMAILRDLTTLPPATWKSEHLDDIAGVVREALDATDLSYTSVLYLTAFIQKLIPAQPVWAARQLMTIYTERGNIGGFSLEGRITDQHALTLEDAFLDVGQKWGRGNRVAWLVWFASALGKRLRVCVRLRQLLTGLLGKESGNYDLSILMLLRKHSPRGHFEELTGKLIAAHESWVALPSIFLFLHEHRQDWLAPFLSKRKFKMKGGTIIELVDLLQAGGYQRYTATQQATLASTLSGIIKLPAGKRLPNDVWVMLRAINFLAMLPAVEPSRLIALSIDVRPVIADAAVRALGRLDGGQGIATLVTALGDARARLAIYALRQAMTNMPAERVIAELRSAPLDKVTVAKETIRLIGEFGGAAGFDALLAMARQKLHRDVYIAVLRGLWDHLERPQAWDIMTEAARNTDGQILNGVVRIPADRLSDDSRRRLIDLLTGLARHPDPIIRMSVLRRFIEMPFPDKEGRLIQLALAALTAASPDERKVAAQAIAANSTTADAPRIAAAVGRLRDQRRPLQDFVEAIAREASADAIKRRRLRPLTYQILDALRSDLLTSGVRLEFAAVMLGTAGFAQELQRLIDESFPIAAVIRDANAAIDRLDKFTDRGELRRLEERLTNSDDPHLRLLAFEALRVQATDHQSWDAARLTRLTAFRNDPAPLVAIRTQFYFDADHHIESTNK